MPKSYSGDLRERVIEAVAAGASRREAAERFEISPSSAVRWIQCWCETKVCAETARGKYFSAGGARGADIGSGGRTTGLDLGGDNFGAA
jgi:transposase-like protein